MEFTNNIIDHIKKELESDCIIDSIDANNILDIIANGEPKVYSDKSGSSFIIYCKDTWDSKFFNRPIYRILYIHSKGRSECLKLLRAVLNEHGIRNSYFISNFCRHKKNIISAVTCYGFRKIAGMVDLVLYPAKSFQAKKCLNDVDIRLFKKEDLKGIEKIALNSFYADRFHRDPFYGGKEGADRYHKEWARNCCRGLTADRVFVAVNNGKAIGFLACKSARAGNDSYVRIVLMAVGKDFSGRGVGTKLLSAMKEYYQKVPIVVRTESDNEASISLYKKSGFKIADRRKYMTFLNN